jgi:hypothetical protein
MKTTTPDANRTRGLFLSAEGHWFHDGDAVRHVRLCALLTRSITRDAQDALMVSTGRDQLPFTAEDAPFQVLTWQWSSGSLSMELSDGSHEVLDERAVFLIDDLGRLRIAVKQGRFWALLTRSATHLIIAGINDAGDGVDLPPGLHARLQPAPAVVDWGAVPSA